MLLTDQMKNIIPNVNWDIAKSYLPFVETVLPQYGIDTTLRKVHFMAQVAHESGGLKFSEENLNYSAKALRLIFRKYFPSQELAEAYHRQPEKIANRVYANRMGNGDEQSGDGWKYRGRGLIQLTGKDNYARFSKDNDIDVVTNPLLLLEPEWALKSACWYWKKRKINRFADEDDLFMVTRKVNGGKHGIKNRQQYLDAFKNLYENMDNGIV